MAEKSPALSRAISFTPVYRSCIESVFIINILSIESSETVTPTLSSQNATPPLKSRSLSFAYEPANCALTAFRMCVRSYAGRWYDPRKIRSHPACLYDTGKRFSAKLKALRLKCSAQDLKTHI